jgi:hypothetical protein
MERLQTALQQALAAFRALGLGPLEKHLVLALLIGAAFFLVVWAIERACGTRGDEYRSRAFLHDAIWWCYYRSGLNYFLVISLLYPALDDPIPWLDLGLLTPYPIWVQALVFFLVSDLYAYWTHRAMHRFAPLWAFHTMHHVPDKITFASSARFHPVEIAVIYFGFYLLVRISGSNPLAWMPVMVFMEVMLQAQHTRIPPLPPFHRSGPLRPQLRGGAERVGPALRHRAALPRTGAAAPGRRGAEAGHDVGERGRAVPAGVVARAGSGGQAGHGRRRGRARGGNPMTAARTGFPPG